MSMDILEGVTNMLCYARRIVTSPVSVPAQLYAAANLAKRGRNNWKVAACVCFHCFVPSLLFVKCWDLRQLQLLSFDVALRSVCSVFFARVMALLLGK